MPEESPAVKRRGKIITVAVAAVFYLVFAGIYLLTEVAAYIFGGEYCDNCTEAEIAANAHPLHVAIGTVALLLVAGIAAGWWWLSRPAKAE